MAPKSDKNKPNQKDQFIQEYLYIEEPLIPYKKKVEEKEEERVIVIDIFGED